MQTVMDSRAAGDGRYKMKVLKNGNFVWTCEGCEHEFKNNGNNLYDCSHNADAHAAGWENKVSAYSTQRP